MISFSKLICLASQSNGFDFVFSTCTHSAHPTYSTFHKLLFFLSV